MLSTYLLYSNSHDGTYAIDIRMTAIRVVCNNTLNLALGAGFAISPIGAPARNDLLELLDDRIGTRSTLITSQLPVKAWHTYLNDPTLADAILDRVVHSSHKIELKGTKSLRDKDHNRDGAPEQ